MSDPPISATFKLLLIGDSGTGKSSLLLQFTDENFDKEINSTIGVDFKIRVVNVDGRRLKLTIWDTAGQERFRTLTSSYYRDAHGVILVYDTTNRTTFTHLADWASELNTYSTTKVVKLVVGNKIDQTAQRQVSTEEGQAYAESLGCHFMECSAKNVTGVKAAFDKLVSEILKIPSLSKLDDSTKAADPTVKVGGVGETVNDFLNSCQC